MRRYYEVKKESDLYNAYFKCLNAIEQVNDLVNSFMKKHGIKTKYYFPSDKYLYIQPTKEDVENYGSDLYKPEKDGLQAFKEYSDVGEDWVKTIEENNLKQILPISLGRWTKGPIPPLMFHSGDKVYCMFEEEPDNTEGLEEIDSVKFIEICNEKIDSPKKEVIEKELNKLKEMLNSNITKQTTLYFINEDEYKEQYPLIDIVEMQLRFMEKAKEYLAKKYKGKYSIIYKPNNHVRVTLEL